MKTLDYASPERWAKYFREEEGKDIQAVTIRRKLEKFGKVEEPLMIIAKDVQGQVYKVYADYFIRELCNDILNMNVASNDGFLEENGVRLGSSGAWEKLLNLKEGTVRVSMKRNGISGLKRRLASGPIRDFYSEIDIRKFFPDFFDELPQSDAEGFFELNGELYGTIYAWAKRLGLIHKTVQIQLEKNNVPFKRGRTKNGRIYPFYPESEVLKACEELLNKYPQADEDGFFILKSKRYGTCRAWSSVFGTEPSTIQNRLERMGITPIDGKSSSGQLHKFYCESDVKKACSDIINKQKADKNGFIVKGGKRLGTINAWSKIFGVSSGPLLSRLGKAAIIPTKERDSVGKVSDFYYESDVKRTCVDIISKKRRADENGFIFVGRERLATCNTWSKLFGVGFYAIDSRLKKAGIVPQQEKDNVGKIANFYKEKDVRKACSDIISV